MTMPPVNHHEEPRPVSGAGVLPAALCIAVTGALIGGYAFLPSNSDFVQTAPVVWLITLVACGAMIAAELARRGPQERLVWPYIAIAALAMVFVGLAIHSTRIHHSGGYKSLGPLITFLSALTCIVICSRTNSRIRATWHLSSVGYAANNRPIYPVVGYAADAQPVTANRAGWVDTRAAGTNAMAIVALITGLFVSPLGIVFGHVALSQINRTGEDGRGMAIAGLVLGYVLTMLMAVALLATTSFGPELGQLARILRLEP